MILTGKHSHKNGFMNNGNDFDGSQQTFPKLLRKAGYQTAIFGKWHLKSLPQGFDQWRVLPGQGQYYNPMVIGPDGRERIEGYCTDVVTDLALDWLRKGRDQDKPFMLMCQHKAPHRCWMPPTRYLNLYDDVTIPEPDTLFDDYADNAPPARHQEMEVDRHMHLYFDLFGPAEPGFDPEAPLRTDKSAYQNYKVMTKAQKDAWDAAFEPKNDELVKANLKGKDLVRWKYQRYMKNYLRCVAGVDRNVGRVLDQLDKAGLSDNTIVVYCADQGFYLGEHGWFDKRWAYEESLKMPLIVRWPGKVEPGTRCAAMVQNIDYAPTMLEAVGLETDWDVHGVSLMPLLTGGGATPRGWRDTIYYRYIDGGHGVAQHSAIRTDDFKLLFFDSPRNEAEENSRWELYDLNSDPQEMHNLASDAKYADKLESMQLLFQQTRERYDDTDESIWKPGPGKSYAAESYIRPPRKR